MSRPPLTVSPLLAAVAIASAALLSRHPLPLAILTAALLLVAPRPRWPVVAFAAIGFVMNGLFSWHGATVLWTATFTVPLMGRPRLTVEALALGGVTALQVAVVALAFLIAFTRTPPQAVARLVPGVGPRIATVVGLRALPDFVRDATALRRGMQVRGLETRGARGAGNLLVPLVARSLDRAATTIEVLHARGAGARPRTAIPLAFGVRDVMAVTVFVALVTAWAVGLWPQAVFFPRLSIASLTDPLVWLPAAPVALVPLVVRR